MEIFDLSAGWFVIVGAVAVGSFSKGITGLGFPLVAIPVMAVFLGVEQAVVVIAIPNVVTNAWLLWEHRREAAAGRHLVTLLVTGLVGTVGGTLLLTAADPRMLSLVLAALVFFYLSSRVARPDFRLSGPTLRWSAPGLGLIGGVLQGLAGISGPLLGPYVHAWGLTREAYVFAISAIFGLFSIVQITTFTVLGLYTPTRLAQSLVALLPTVLILPVSIRLARRMNTRRFEAVLFGVMALMGVRLLLDGLGLTG